MTVVVTGTVARCDGHGIEVCEEGGGDRNSSDTGGVSDGSIGSIGGVMRREKKRWVASAT